jgi:dethiobiotin synthetase
VSHPAGSFITGTDTGVGKTVVTLGLMQLLQDQGQQVAAMKPVACGSERTESGLRNEDARLLRQQASMALEYECVNPYAFEPAIAPHIAAEMTGIRIDIKTVLKDFGLMAAQADSVCVEGVGGWLVPLNEDQTMADLAARLGLEVILVVGLRLGCLNHALLTSRAVAAADLKLTGWVANQLPPGIDAVRDNIEALKSRISAPLLGVVPPLRVVTAEAVAACLVLD